MALRYYLNHLRDVVDHKCRVGKHCLRLGVPFFAVLHDLSKFHPDEFIPYANFWGSGKGDGLRKNGYYDPYNTGDSDYDNAVMMHVCVNKHHWQFWVLPISRTENKVYEMPLKYRKEMLADWFGAGERAAAKAGRQWDISWTRQWYITNIDKMLFAPDTQNWIERQLGILGDGV